MIGVLALALLIFTGKQFGISLSLKAMCAMPLKGIFKNNSFFNYEWRNDLWRVIFVLGIALGGFIGNVLLKNPEGPKLSEKTVTYMSSQGIQDFSTIVPADLFALSHAGSVKILLFLFVGGFLVAFGSRYANGCTSGHAIMGISYFQFASIMAAMGFFIGGLFMVHVIYPNFLYDFLLGGN